MVRMVRSRRRLLCGWGRVALILMLLLSGVANAYCSVDRGPLPVKGDQDHALQAPDAGSAAQALSDDDGCNVSDDLSSMQAPDTQHPGDAATLAVQVLAFRLRSYAPLHATFFSFPNQPAPSWESVFQRVPRLLI